MKGVIVQTGEKKSVVMFNNGKIGVIPSPPQCQIGMVINISYNGRKLFLLAAFAVIVFVCFIILARNWYVSPAGYLHIIYGNRARVNVSLELTYNRFGRVISARPFNTLAVAILTDMPLQGKRITEAYQTILSSSESLRSQNRVVVRIAGDNLDTAKQIEQDLTILTGNNSSITFELYTIELYQKALPETGMFEPETEWHRNRRERWDGNGQWGHWEQQDGDHRSRREQQEDSGND